MDCYKVSVTGHFLYFSLSILMNLFILMIRISGHEIQNNGTTATATTTHHINDIVQNDANSSNDRAEAVTSSSFDVYTGNDTDIHNIIANYHQQLNKSLAIFHHALATATATAPFINRKYSNQNELDGNLFTDTSTNNTNETLATVIPVPASISNASTNLLNEHQTYTALLATSHQITTVTSTIQQPLLLTPSHQIQQQQQQQQQQQPSSLQQIKNETKTIVALRNQLDLRALTKS